MEKQYHWIIKIFQSCENMIQLNNAYKLIQLFHVRWNNDFYYRQLYDKYKDFRVQFI